MTVSTPSSTHPNGQEGHAEAGTDTLRSGRDGKGRFVKGNAGGPGNPFNRQVAALRQQVLDALTPERMGQIIEAVAQKAEAGDLAAAKLLWQYGMGKPAATVQPDRMDIEELALYQEQQLSPEAWVNIIKSIPAEMACQMLRPIMPVLNQSAAKNLLQMAEQSGIEVSKPAPSVTGHNGEHAPLATGDNGQDQPTANGGNGTRAPMTNGGNGSEGGTGQVNRADAGGQFLQGMSVMPARGTDGAKKRKLTRAERRAEAVRLQRLQAKWGLR